MCDASEPLGALGGRNKCRNDEIRSRVETERSGDPSFGPPRVARRRSLPRRLRAQPEAKVNRAYDLPNDY